MAELLDEALFDGKTYGDLAGQQSRPGLLIHASDMATLSRFEFLQPQFDLLCSDMSQLPIAYASAASAALPLVLSPITLTSYAGHCGYQPSSVDAGGKQVGKPVSATTSEGVALLPGCGETSLCPSARWRIIGQHGLDEVFWKGSASVGRARGIFKSAGVKQVKKLVILSVNAETSPDVKEYRSDEVPVFSRAFSSMVDIPINRYSADTLLLVRFAVEKWRDEIRNRPPGTESGLAPDADIYFIDASLGSVEDPVEQEYLMKIPTTLYLTDEQIDHLLLAASRLIYKDPEFQRLMTDLQGSP